ncbi:MAG: chemotaxis protein CheB, partial [Bacteroidia bacterium]
MSPALKKKRPVKKKAAAGRKKEPFSIVAIGASAGGLDAVRALLQSLPSDTGMAYIYIQHLSPHHPSTLASLLSRFTHMKVKEVSNMMRIEPDVLYVCTPDKEMHVLNEKIKLTPRLDKDLPYLPIDKFFTSLATGNGSRVIGIILSGNAMDGTQGLKAIQKAGGITFAQDSSAKYSSMPASAIKEGVIDHVLSPKEMALELERIGKSGPKQKAGHREKQSFADNSEQDLKAIFALVQKEKGVDFSHYKMTTIRRRLSHRMMECHAGTVKEYIKLLGGRNKEIDKLYKDILINVTGFFRDPETFRYLKTAFLPKLLQGKSSGETLRIWIPACSTGEEAYSIGMLVTELLDDFPGKITVQIFATDVSTEAIHDARRGEYSKADLKAVSQKRIARFFVKTNKGYHVASELREICVFATQNILRDPPFSKMDFISCRNLLIYFDAIAQKRAIATMHFALASNGFLLLGKSETIGNALPLFTQISNKHNIYSRDKNSRSQKLPELEPGFHRMSPSGSASGLRSPAKKAADAVEGTELDNAINTILLADYMPACAVINKNMEILQFRGSTALYLSHPAGRASLNILKMTRPEFAFELRSAIQKVFKTRKAVSKPGIEMKIDSAFRTFSLEVSPLVTENNELLLLVVFNLLEAPADMSDPENKSGLTDKKDLKIKKLTEELNSVRAEIHSMVEMQETANEQLQAANEEIVSSNEEFQTLNEELETSKEEIEASNEELISTNRELQIRNELLTESYNYSEAIIDTIHEPMMILDENLVVKSASKSFYKKFLMAKEDTEGTSLFKLGNRQWNIPKLKELLEDVLAKNMDFDNFEVTASFPKIGQKILLLNAHRILQKNHKEQLILLAIDDITERSLDYLKEKELLNKDIRSHQLDKEELERAVRRRTRQLQHNNKELEMANKDLTSFTYVSSHDLQEPLRKIQNFVACLLEEEEQNLSESGKQYFSRMGETARRMQALIEDLLKYSRTKSGEQVFEY